MHRQSLNQRCSAPFANHSSYDNNKGPTSPSSNVKHILIFSSRGDFKQVHSVLDYCPSCRTAFRPLVMRSCYPSMMDSTAHKNRGSINYKNVLRKSINLHDPLHLRTSNTDMCSASSYDVDYKTYVSRSATASWQTPVRSHTLTSVPVSSL